MRVTFNMRGMQMKDMLATSLQNYTEAQKKVNAKRDLLTPWQNSTKYVSAYSVQTMVDELTQFGENAENASNWLNNADTELKELLEALKEARDDYAIAGSTGSYDEESRMALAQDVRSLYNQIMDIANASYMGRYIFGGYSTGTPPFSGGSNSVSNVITKNENGQNLSADATVRDVFGDLTELSTGRYRANITVKNGIASLRLYDEKGNVVIMDSNGSDESGKNGNNSTTYLQFEYEPGKVINTGRGISLKMPDDLENPTSVVIEFDYKSGSEITYRGDNGYIYTQIGYNQDIAINMPGSSIFTQSSLILQSARANTVNGLPATMNTLFSNLDNTNVSIGDSIKVSGTDHNGNVIGTAKLLSASNPSLDLSSASENERTLNIAYGDKLYKIIVPQKPYNTTDELAAAINYELKNAEYLGAIGDLSGTHATMDDYAATVEGELNSGKFPGEINDVARNNYKVDLSSQIKISADGDRLEFSSKKAGDNVRIAVNGGDRNKLGFQNQTIAASGKDTVFELGYDFHTDTIEPIQTTHNNVNLNNTSYTVFVNGEEVTITKPATVVSVSNMTGVSFGTSDTTLHINGKEIIVNAVDFNNAADKETYVKGLLSAAGLDGEAAITGWVDNLDGTYDFDIETTSPAKKDLEYAFDQALRKAGFDFGVGVRLEGVSNDAADLGIYNVTFNLSNYNMDRDSQLTTTFYDTAVLPPASDMKTAQISKIGLNSAEEKTIGDYVAFLEELYGKAVDVSFDKGKLIMQDLRSGESKLTFRTNIQNQGITHANDQVTIVSGAYTGYRDDTWNITVKTTLGMNDQRNISINIVDKRGGLVYDDVIVDYKGGSIELPNGVTIIPDDMEIPNPLDPALREATASFYIDLKAEPNLSFGDMNIVETGKNVNVFRSLENLIHALEYNITKNGFSEPSSWRASDLQSSAQPFLDGVFRGNFNDNWKYEIQGQSSNVSFYLQNEFKDTSGTVRYNTALGTDTPLKFSIDILDNKTKTQKRVDVDIDLSKAVPAVTDAKSAQQYILKELNSNPDLTGAGIRFTDNNGKIEIQSGSGTRIANFANSAADAAERAFASYIMGFDTLTNGELESNVTVTAAFTFNVFDPLAADPDKVKSITIPAPAAPDVSYTRSDLLDLINTELALAAPAGTDGRIKATIGKDGGIVFSDSRTDEEVEASFESGTYNPLKLALEHDAAGNMAELLVSGVQSPKTDLSEADEAARTLTVKYTIGNPADEREVKIILDKKAYSSASEIAEAINEQLANAGIAGNDMKASVNSKGEIAFVRLDKTFHTVTVEGDYAGSLGFPGAGDSVDIKVTNGEGALVQNVSLDTANRSVFVSDGLYLGFDAGSLSATDYFTAAIGSGTEEEIDVLDAAVNQVLSAATIIGTRGNRVSSVIKFQETVISSSEEIKAGYLGSTAIDQIKLSTDLKLAETAYQTAMSMTAKMLSISILDFLG